MRLKILATAVLVANISGYSASADSILPHLQPAEPVFEKSALRKRAQPCNGFATYGNTIQQTVRATVVDPFVAILDDVARLFSPFFSDVAAQEERRRAAVVSKNRLAKSPSNIVRIAANKRICS